MLVDALLTPGGLSRAILTSRIRASGLPDSIEIIPVHALPLDEALLLVRELPNFRRLLDGKVRGVPLETGRQLVRRTLRLVQGHPKLIELAENLAADPQRLTAQLDRAEATQGASELDAFFRDGQTRFDGAMFTATLRDWSAGIAGALPEAARTFFHFLCALEENDRLSAVIEANWADLLKRLGRPGPVPDIAQVLAPLTEAGLVDQKQTSEDGKRFGVLIHPGVAEAGRAEAGPAFQEAVDIGLAATWRTLMARGLQEYGESPEAGNIIVRAGLAAFPYLARRGEWRTASSMLEQVDLVDYGPATVAALLPRMRRVVEATTGTEGGLTDRFRLARFLKEAGQMQEAEAEMRAVITRAVELKEFRLASSVAGDLTNLLMDTGRLSEALNVIGEKPEYTKRAGLGPWAQLSDECWRLQILIRQGKNEKVLQRVMELREHMKTLPDPAGPNENVSIWNVREITCDIGRACALRLGAWQQALDLSREGFESKRERGATALEQARLLFNDYGPLLRLRRYDETGELLRHCREVAERENSVELLGAVFSALADLQDELGHPETAQHFEETALRFSYAEGTPEGIGVSHSNLPVYIA